ncbi:MAG: MBL fold metallo-hydrolase [Saprospiraceae bacterium]
MILKSVLAGTFKLDGGAMFGVVPKKIWSKLLPPDENNLCSWAMRCLYIENGDRKILIDTGLGNKQSDRFFSYYEPKGDILIQDALKTAGIDPDSITDILFTHLHFDHVGGALFKNESGDIKFAFPNARHFVHKEHWNNAITPNAREKASFLKENLEPLADRIIFLEDNDSSFEQLEFVKVNGHTIGMILPLIHFSAEKKILYCADLFPAVHHIPLPYIMAYDMQPLITLKEKETILTRAINEDIALFFEHDYLNEIAIVGKAGDDKYFVKSCTTLEDYLKN